MNKPAFAGFAQSAQANLISPITHEFNRGGDVWTRYRCGVACGSGELVEQQKPLEGGSWTTSALYLQGISPIRRNSEWHHFDPQGTAGVITNSSASVISNNLYDLFGVKRYEQGSAQTPHGQKLREGGKELIHAQVVVWSNALIRPLVHAMLKAPCLSIERRGHRERPSHAEPRRMSMSL